MDLPPIDFTPQRADAAQMAGRNIKSAKGGRHPSRRPVRPQWDGDSVPLFAPIPSPDDPIVVPNVTATGGNLLFGGTVQAEGTFSFSGPEGLSYAKARDEAAIVEAPITELNDGTGRFGGDNRGGKRAFGASKSERPPTRAFNPIPSNDRYAMEQKRKDEEKASLNQPFTIKRYVPDPPMLNRPFTITNPGFNSNNGPLSPGKSEFTLPETSQFTPASIGDGSGANISAAQPESTSFNHNMYDGPPQAQGSIFGNNTTTPQPQKNTPFQFFNTAPTPTSNTNFGTFNSNFPTVSKPTSNFGGFNNNNFPTASEPTSNFGGFNNNNFPTASEPTSNFGGFNNNYPTSEPTTNFDTFNNNFPTASAPTNPLFGNTQTSAPFTSSEMNFGASSSTSQHMNNLFGASAPSAGPSGNIGSAPTYNGSPFSSAGPSPGFNGPTSFENLHQASAEANNMFSAKNMQQAPAEANNMSSAQNIQPGHSQSLFGHLNPVASQPEPFSQLTPAPAPQSMFFNNPNSIFNSPSKPEAGKSLFGNLLGAPAQQAPQAVETANTDNRISTDNLFGNLNKPVDTSVAESKVNGFNPSTLPQSSSLFGAPKPLFSAPSASLNVNKAPENKNASSEATTNENPKNSPFSSGTISSPTKESSNSKNIFSSPSSLDLPSSANQPPPSGMFPPLTQPTTDQIPNEPPHCGVAKMPVQPQDSDADSEYMRQFAVILNMPESELEKDVQISPEVRLRLQDPLSRRQFFTACRLKELNKKLSEMFRDIAWGRDPSNVLKFYMEQRVEILKAAELYGGKKRKQPEEGFETSTRPQKCPNQLLNSIANSTSNQQSANGGPGLESRVESEPSKPTDQVGATNIGLTPTNGASQKDTSQVGPSQTFNTLGGSPVKNALNPMPASSPAKNSIFSGPPKNPFIPADHPQKKVINSFTNPAASAPTPSKGKRKAEDDLREVFEPVKPLRTIKTPKLNGSFMPSSEKASNEGSSTSAIFKGIVNTPSKLKSDPQKTENDERPRFNPFGSLPIPNSPANPQAEPSTSGPAASKPTAQTSSPSNMFSIKGAATAAQPNMFTPKDVSNSSQFTPKAQSTSISQNRIANPFQIKPTAGTNGPGDSSKPKPPTFGNLSGMNAMEQFRQKAEQDAKAKEEKDMEKDKDNEWESDEETESDYERKWYARRAEEKKRSQEEQEKLKNAGPKFIFKPTQDSSSSAKGNAAGSSLFAHTSGQSSDNSGANSMNGSRTSTPGPIRSSTGSVLDGHGANLPVKNIFGHLSDTGSGQDDKDDESDADDEDDSENKDPNYYPSAENDSGPGTPVEETGAGIASAKKTSIFGSINGTSFGTPTNSGTSTPGRSLFDRIGPKPVADTEGEVEKPAGGESAGGLFDRIDKVSNGNPLCHISSEEKENTQPNSANVFNTPLPGSTFSKPFAKPADQTWNPDSPIKFGQSTTTGRNSPPTVSFTAATPTKTPSNMFGSVTGSSSRPSEDGRANKPTVSPFSGLFGNSGTNNKGPSSSTGFTFSSTPKTTTSLLPSAAGSAATSRGTSPGGTTDGASDADADPDAEHHEQINLTAGGPGEENEEVVYEVRAKALTWDAGERLWKAKGLGPLRVLKHKESGVARVLLRGDPSGKVILNKGILGNLNYEASAKTVKFLTAEGQNLETFMLQVKTPEFAQKLADALNENKAK